MGSGPLRRPTPSTGAPACAVGNGGASGPVFGKAGPGKGRPTAGRTGATGDAGATRPPAAGLNPAGGAGEAEAVTFSAVRETGAGLGGGGGGGGGGTTTALRAAALISAMVRVSGCSSGLISSVFFASICAGGVGVPTASGAGSGAGASAGAASSVLSARKCARTFSAISSSRALECECLSVIPISGRYSNTTLLLTSNSRARSLIRILPMLFFGYSLTSVQCPERFGCPGSSFLAPVVYV